MITPRLPPILDQYQCAEDAQRGESISRPEKTKAHEVPKALSAWKSVGSSCKQKAQGISPEPPSTSGDQTDDLQFRDVSCAALYY